MPTLVNDIEYPEPAEVQLTADSLVVTLIDGRRIEAPLWWYPRLFNASAAQRGNFELSPFGLHWPEIDEDLSFEGLFARRKAPGAYQNLRAFSERFVPDLKAQKLNFALGDALTDSMEQEHFTYLDFERQLNEAA